jgi:hypothetical protein
MADFYPVTADSVRRPTRRRGRLLYRLPRLITGPIRLIFTPSPLIRFGAQPVVTPGRFIGCLDRLPAESDQFLPRRRRFGLTAFGSSLNRTEWGTTNPLFDRVGETEYHIHE